MLMCFYTSISQVLGFLIIKFCLTCWIRKAHGITKTAMLHALFFKELVVGVILIVVFWGFQRRASCRFRETKKKTWAELNESELRGWLIVLHCPTLSHKLAHVAIGIEKCGWSERRCAVSLKYTSDFRDLLGEGLWEDLLSTFYYEKTYYLIVTYLISKF